MDNNDEYTFVGDHRTPILDHTFDDLLMTLDLSDYEDLGGDDTVPS